MATIDQGCRASRGHPPADTPPLLPHRPGTETGPTNRWADHVAPTRRMRPTRPGDPTARRVVRRLAVIGVWASVVLGACTTQSIPEPTNLDTATELERIAEARSTWLQLSSIPYEMTFTVDCSCDWATDSTTVAGRAGQDGSRPAEDPEDVHVDLLFTTLRSIVALDPAVFFVEFDPTTGAPLRIVVDLVDGAHDDEWAFWLTSIRPVGREAWR